MRQKLNLAGLVFTVSLIVAGSITGASQVPVAGLPTGGALMHLTAYFVLAAAFLVNFHDTRRGHLEAIIASGGLALGLEMIQLFLPYRSFSLIDFGVSFAGASLVTLDHHIDLVTDFVELEDKVIEKLISG